MRPRPAGRRRPSPGARAALRCIATSPSRPKTLLTIDNQKRQGLVVLDTDAAPSPSASCHVNANMRWRRRWTSRDEERAMTIRPSGSDVITDGRAVLGIELGSTRIKAVLIDPHGTSSPAAATPGRTSSSTACGPTRWTTSGRECRTASPSMCRRRTGTARGAPHHLGRARGVRDDARLPARSTPRATCWCRSAPGATRTPSKRPPSSPSCSSSPSRCAGRSPTCYQAILDEEPHVARVALLTTLAGLRPPAAHRAERARRR